MTMHKEVVISLNDLRHAVASRLVMAGVDLRTVQGLMGHQGIQMTVRYAHLAPTHQLAAVERLVSVGMAVENQGPTGTRTSTVVLDEKVAESATVH